MTAAKSAARRLVHAETKYDQRIIGAIVLAAAWCAFWIVTDRIAADTHDKPPMEIVNGLGLAG